MYETLSAVPIAAAALRERVARVPRVSLAKLPTPLDEAPRFSAALGGPRILIKREDLTGLAFGGNKTRMLEFRMANALKEGRRLHHQRCRRAVQRLSPDGRGRSEVGPEGLPGAEGARDRPDAHPQGNFLLDKLLGAEVITIGPMRRAASNRRSWTWRSASVRRATTPTCRLQDLHLWAVGLRRLLPGDPGTVRGEERPGQLPSI